MLVNLIPEFVTRITQDSNTWLKLINECIKEGIKKERKKKLKGEICERNNEVLEGAVT
jgi:hypothetical protein